MYKEFYGFKENPFNITADPDFFFSSIHHGEAFSHLVFGIQQRKGILVVTGEVGTGKTTLCRALLNRIDKNTKTALILNPNFSDIQLLRLIIQDLGIPGVFKNKFELINGLNEFLLEETRQGHNVAIIIDEAQNLNPRQLEQIRLLSNLETEKQKLLQIILVGQPELNEKLNLPSLRQLNQRVAVRYRILPLECAEVEQYVQHRVRFALTERAPAVQFTSEAYQTVYRHTRGVPRLINIICDRGLLAGYAAQSRVIDHSILNTAIKELFQL
ncbi:MAG: AAA family ATPase [Candidatus Omnitrophica bacterium]|nr:AAA family ATPase [Candidatus Omnitrophota bacterium]